MSKCPVKSCKEYDEDSFENCSGHGIQWDGCTCSDYNKYFDKIISCKCGCGGRFKRFNKYGRERKYISGHNGKKYDDPKQHKREWNHRNREQRLNYKTQLITKFKKELVLEKDGKCKNCGIKYDGNNLAIFDFHHRDPSVRLFGVNKRNMNKRSKQELRDEAKKCDLLCANCHRLKHWGGQ